MCNRQKTKTKKYSCLENSNHILMLTATATQFSKMHTRRMNFQTAQQKHKIKSNKKTHILHSLSVRGQYFYKSQHMPKLQHKAGRLSQHQELLRLDIEKDTAGGWTDRRTGARATAMAG